MPVRKIPKNHIFVTGLHATSKSVGDADFESTLEKDYLIVLDFDERVREYEVQPVRLPVPGVANGYVPDVLVHFHPDELGRAVPSELTEVKTRADFEKHHADYSAKFIAAEAYAAERGWRFVRKDERDARPPRLKNLKFLRRYREMELDAESSARPVAALTAFGRSAKFDELVAELAATPQSRAAVIPVLWCLVAQRRILVDLDVPFHSETPLSLPE